MNIVQHIERAARLFPERTAILFEGTPLSYAELNIRMNRVANALRAHGVRAGDRAALYLPNIPEFAVCYGAVLKLGAVAVSINSMFKGEEVRHVVNDSGAKVIFTVEELLPNVPGGECPTLQHVVICEGNARDCKSLSDWLMRGSSSLRAKDMQRDDAAALLYTSGTTGVPKGATLSHGNVVSNMYSSMHHGGYRPEDRMLVFLPLFHVFAQNYIMNATFTACATVVLQRRFVIDQALEAVERDRVTGFFGVPTVYINLLATDLSRCDLSPLRYEFSAAAKMPEEVSRAWTERFGRRVYEGYGLTECSPCACYNHDFRHKFGSVGTPIENCEVKILDADDREVQRGDLGEICISGPGVMKGYWRRPDETAQVLRDGWLHSGDIGMMDDEGYVFIVDRVKDLINISGFKVWPAEVEKVLYRHPAVKEVAVFGIPHSVKGESVGAAVLVKEGMSATANDIMAFCRERMAVYKVPSSVTFATELPKSASGKTLKRVLRAQHESI